MAQSTNYKAIILDNVISSDSSFAFWALKEKGIYTLRIFIAEICFEIKIESTKYQIIDFNFFECKYEILAVFTFEEMHKHLSADSRDPSIGEDVCKMIAISQNLASKIKAKNLKANSVFADDGKFTFTINEFGKICKFESKKLFGYTIFREFSSILETEVAKFGIENKIPLLFVIHNVKHPPFDKREITDRFYTLSFDMGRRGYIGKLLDKFFIRAKYEINNSKNIKELTNWASSAPSYAPVVSIRAKYKSDYINYFNLLSFVRKEDYKYSNQKLFESLDEANSKMAYLKHDYTIDEDVFVPKKVLDDRLKRNSLLSRVILDAALKPEVVPTPIVLQEEPKRIDEGDYKAMLENLAIKEDVPNPTYHTVDASLFDSLSFICEAKFMMKNIDFSVKLRSKISMEDAEILCARHILEQINNKINL